MRRSDEFFHSRIDQMIDLRHPLSVLALHMHLERWNLLIRSLIFAFRMRDYDQLNYEKST